MDLITNTHTDDCIHTPYYQGTDDCERSEGWWAQPDGGYVSEARSQLEDDAPWCRIQGLAWELAEAAEEA
jgi:hypothetical protein